jgi:VWFA-related protein
MNAMQWRKKTAPNTVSVRSLTRLETRRICVGTLCNGWPITFRRVNLLLTVLFAGACTLSGQQVRPPAVGRPPIILKTELVQVPVVVFDDKGAVATDLKKSDFRLLDDGVVQQLQYLDKVRRPVSFVVVVDLSSSMTRKMTFVLEASLSLLDPLDVGDHSYDEYSFIGIGTHARELISFTQDQDELRRRLPLLITGTNESTALFDGIYLGVTNERREAANPRRAIIIISDGGDNHSLYNVHETRKLLEEADVPVFAVMAGPSLELPALFSRKEKKQASNGPLPQFSGLPFGAADDDYIGPAEREGPHNLSSLTEVTGGGTFTAANEEDLARIVRTIGLAVRYQYVLGYRPSHDESSDTKKQKGGSEAGSHKIRVELYPKEKFEKYSSPYYRRSYNTGG